MPLRFLPLRRQLTNQPANHETGGALPGKHNVSTTGYYIENGECKIESNES